jgi:hypothetical protein
VIVMPNDRTHHRTHIVIDFVREAKKGGLFHERSYPWLKEAGQGEWPYRELLWVWKHPVLFAGAVFWPILCAIIVLWVSST